MKIENLKNITLSKKGMIIVGGIAAILLLLIALLASGVTL